MSINTIIFDLDGTLLNTLGDLHVSFNYALKICGYKERSFEEVRSFVGNGIKKAFERAVGEFCEETALDELVEVFKWYYTNHMYEVTAPYDGIMEMLKTLKEKNFAMAIVSNKYDAAVKELCRKYFKDYITTAIGESEEIRKKPSSDGIIKALGELGKGFDDVIYAGDSEVDIQTAANANIPCISVLWGFKDEEFLKKNGGKIFVKKPADIIKIVEKK